MTSLAVARGRFSALRAGLCQLVCFALLGSTASKTSRLPSVALESCLVTTLPAATVVETLEHYGARTEKQTKAYITPPAESTNPEP